MRGRIELLLKQNKLGKKHIKDILQVHVLKDILVIVCIGFCVDDAWMKFDVLLNISLDISYAFPYFKAPAIS